MISDTIKRLRERDGVSQSALGRALGIRQSTVAMWESGKNNPGYETLLRIADFFNVGVDELFGTAPSKIPVLGKVQAGIPRDAVEDIIGYEEIPEEMQRGGEYFALQIKGDSMEPRMREGDIVIVRRQESVSNGEIAIVLVGGGDATCKKFYRSQGGISLVSINPQYEPMFYSEEDLKTTSISVLGRVCELRARF